jgi:hypothetical protein
VDSDIKIAGAVFGGIAILFIVIAIPVTYADIRTKEIILETIKAGVPPLEAKAAIRDR